VDDQFPLWLISGQRHLRSFNSWTHNMSNLSAKLPEPAATIHPDLADSHGLVEGDTIELSTRHGTITIEVKVSDGIRSDTVAVPQFWGHNYDSGQRHARSRPGVNVNHLHNTTDVDAYTAMPIFNGRPCAIQSQPVRSVVG